MTDAFAVMNAIGLVGFAFVGAATAIEERYDVFGVTVVGVMTALRGGTTRAAVEQGCRTHCSHSANRPVVLGVTAAVRSCISSMTGTSIRSS